jgi:hypothetical protein
MRVDAGHKSAVQPGNHSLLGLPHNQRGQVTVDDASRYLRLRFSWPLARRGRQVWFLAYRLCTHAFRRLIAILPSLGVAVSRPPRG